MEQLKYEWGKWKNAVVFELRMILVMGLVMYVPGYCVGKWVGLHIGMLNSFCVLFGPSIIFSAIFLALILIHEKSIIYSKPVKNKIFIKIHVTLNHGKASKHGKILFSSKNNVSFWQINKIVREKFDIESTTALYFFNGKHVLGALETFKCGKHFLRCVSENKFGGKENEKSKNDEQTNKKTNNKKTNKMAKGNKSNKNVVTALYSNTNGLTKEKVLAIKEEAKNDSFILGTEWNKTEMDTSVVADYFGKFALVKSCHDITYHSNGTRIRIDRKKKGYGTGIVAKETNVLKRYDNLIDPEETKFEINAAVASISKNQRIGCVIVYRSPSMTRQDEIDDFYTQVDRYIRHMRSNDDLCGVVYIGDPNTESSSRAKTAESAIMQKHGLVDLIPGMATREGSETQPDSCFAWFDVSKISISAGVIGRIHQKMDHRAIRLNFVLKGVEPKIRKFKDVKYKRRRKDVTDEKIGEILRENFSTWQSKYKTLIFDVAGNERNVKVADTIVDKATNDFLRIIDDVKNIVYEEVEARWPIDTPAEADHLTVEISQLSAKLAELSCEIMKDNHNVDLMNRFIELEKEKLTKMQEKVQSRIELCMHHQLNNMHNKQTDNLFKWTKKLLSREGFLTEMKDLKTDEEIRLAIEECDKTFTNSESGFSPNLDSYVNIINERKYNVNEWNPVGCEVDPLAEYISQKKKIDPFYKNHASTLSNPTFVLLKLIENADYFPEALRYSKLTILPSRFIFSLDALPKIIESILAIEFNKCMQKDYEVNGDPEQMAYEPNRGTTSCNAITYTHVDMLLAIGKPCIQSFIDIRKAFNVMCRETMLKVLQKIAGAGRLIASRFKNRTYIAPDGCHYGHDHNRGVDAGCPIPVCSFKAGINNDVSLTGLNVELEWASLYSDDRSALADCAKKLQSAIDGSLSWAERRNIKYHDGKNCCIKNGVSMCKKYPATMIYKRGNVKVPDNFYEIKLGDIPFKNTVFQRNLGLNVYTDSGKSGYKAILNKQGYYFIPEIERIKSLAYRLQEIKFDFVPHFLKTMVLCYFCGIINNAACLYWCRSRVEDLNKLRFYYAMGLSAVVGETAMSTLGPGCCKSCSVSKESSRMRVLREMVGVKSLEEIAMTDAVATIKQVVTLRPEWFRRPNSGRKRRSKNCRYTELSLDDNFVETKHVAFQGLDFPLAISDDVAKRGALIGDIWRLAVRKVVKDFETNKNTKVNNNKFKYKFEELWLLAEQSCRDHDKSLKASDIIKTYHAACKDYLGSLDVQERRLNNRTVTRPLKPHRTCKVSPPIWLKRGRVNRGPKFKFSCKSKAPGAVSLSCDNCVVCGVATVDNTVSELGKCKLCKRLAHVKCLDRLLLKHKFHCSDISRHLQKIGVEKKDSVEFPVKPARPDSRCLICGDGLETMVIRCSESNCGYGAHEACAAILKRICGNELRSDLFSCNDVTYYIKPAEVVNLMSTNSMLVNKTTQLVTRRGKVNYKKYTPKRKRYENPDSICSHCNETIAINEESHLLTYCRARYAGTPVPRRDHDNVVARFKRLRRMALNDYPP